MRVLFIGQHLTSDYRRQSVSIKSEIVKKSPKSIWFEGLHRYWAKSMFQRVTTFIILK